MSSHGRKYGDRDSHRICVWNGVLEAKHRERIGPALWEFLWCLDTITFEKEGKGFVLGGAPISFTKVAKGFGVNEQTVRAHFDLLARHRYIERIRTPRGYSIRVLNSAKFTRQMSSDRGKTPDQVIVEESTITSTEIPDHFIENPRSNKTMQLEKAVDEAAAAPTVPLRREWAVLGVDLPIGPPLFQDLWRTYFENWDDIEPLSKVMERCLQYWQRSGRNCPRPFIEAKRRVEQSEKASSPRNELSSDGRQKIAEYGVAR